jgi:hypothetical protein
MDIPIAADCILHFTTASRHTGVAGPTFGAHGILDPMLQLDVDLDVTTPAIGSSSPPLRSRTTS